MKAKREVSKSRKHAGGRIARRMLADKKTTGGQPAYGKMARKRVRRGRKAADRKTGRRKIGRTKLTKTKIAGLQASADEELQPLANGDYRAWRRPNKKRITLFLDADVLAWFKESGRRYQTRINRALWKVMQEEKEESGK